MITIWDTIMKQQNVVYTGLYLRYNVCNYKLSRKGSWGSSLFKISSDLCTKDQRQVSKCMCEVTWWATWRKTDDIIFHKTGTSYWRDPSTNWDVRGEKGDYEREEYRVEWFDMNELTEMSSEGWRMLSDV